MNKKEKELIELIRKDAFEVREKELKKMSKRRLIKLALELEDHLGALPFNPLKFGLISEQPKLK